VAAGVAGDDKGNLFVADKGRNVVMMFDKDHQFVAEFGEYGDRPENLVRPEQVAWSPAGKLYVTQMRNRGVSVFDAAAK
jgi:DNA-binding beta-propeller fold protein YncE